MLTFEMIIVFLGLIGMVTALVLDKMRPGMILFSVTVLFLCFGILTPKEMLEGFSNKGMITVALLFLISEGVRQSGALGQLIKKLLPQEKTTVMKAQARMLPAISFVSAFLNNTPVVVIFAPIIKRWAESVRIPATKFLIPLSYATILGGMCTLIGTSTNLVVDGMILDAGYKGFGMFELGRVGIFIALAGIVYLLFFSPFLPTMGSTNSNKVLTDSSKLSLEVSKDKAGCSGASKGAEIPVKFLISPRRALA
jgi:di/tricarboxylate transporter